MANYIYGKNVVRQRILSNKKIHRLFFNQKHPDTSLLELAKKHAIPYELVQESFLNKIDLHHQGIVAEIDAYKIFDLEEVLKSYRWVKHEKVPSFFTADEVRAIETSIDRSSGVGKRNYAMLLLASRLGLRASDIAYLKFSNIDWEKNEIRLVQYKTGNPVSLPLLNDVGSAIIDYLKYGRFKSESQQIFISSRAPYVPANKSIVCSAIQEVIKKSEVKTDGRRHGPHSLRRSLASCLLKNEVPMPVISEALGHVKTDTTMTYLRIDLTSLMKCALAVPPIEDDFYTQKGGAFYA